MDRVKLVLALLAAAAPAAAQDDSLNASSWYRKSFERLAALGLSDAEWETIRTFQQDPAAAPTPEVRDLLARAQPVLSAFARGAAQAYSDFGLDYSEGFEMVLPHLSPLRNIGRLVTAEAKLRLHDGDAGGAVDRLTSLYRAAGHLSSDGTLISSLVSQAIYRNADVVVKAGLDEGVFGPAESGALRDALRELSGRDGFGVLSALDMERVVVTDWVREKYAEAEDRAEMIDELSFDGAPPGAAASVAGMLLLDQQQFEHAVEQTELLMGRVRAAFEMEDPEEARFELQRIIEEVQGGEHGPLAMMLVPNYRFVYDRLVELQEQIAERLAQLSAIASGVMDPQALANAAVWYLRAAGMVEALDERIRAQLRRLAADPMLPVEGEAAETLKQAGAIIDTLRAGSLKPRCDFAIVHQGRPGAFPPYLAGLRDSAALLQADAIRRLDDGRPSEAVDRLATCFRMSGHVAGDPAVTTSLVSHAIFDATIDIARWGIGLLDTGHRRTLVAAVETMSRRDPFGYVAATQAARGQIIERLRLAGETRRRAEVTVQRLDGDRLLFMLVVLDAGETDAPPPAAASLGDVFSAENVRRAAAQAPQVRGLVTEAGDLSPLFDRVIPAIGRVQERFAEARSDYARAVMTLLRE